MIASHVENAAQLEEPEFLLFLGAGTSLVALISVVLMSGWLDEPVQETSGDPGDPSHVEWSLPESPESLEGPRPRRRR